MQKSDYNRRLSGEFVERGDVWRCRVGVHHRRACCILKKLWLETCLPG